MTPDKFREAMIDAYVKGECKGPLRSISPQYRGR
jgi:hypothetical protein